MFTVGEFSRLAQVSKRLLRYYDEIGLLTPVQVDAMTGYRYYSAEQMSDLNRILALKELGLTLDQIQRLVNDHVSTEELQGMLLLKKAEIEQHLRAEMQRIRSIESRLQSIRDAEAGTAPNVVIKQIGAQPVLSTRALVETFDAALDVFDRIRRALPGKSAYGLCFCMCHSDGIVDRDMDLEMGCLVEAQSHAPVPLDNGLRLVYRELPPADTMATIVVKGAMETIHTGYTALGLWVEANGYRMAGVPRELTLQVPTAADGSDLVTEIQFPLELAYTP